MTTTSISPLSMKNYVPSENKPEGFFYLDHRTTDLKYNSITDVHVTPANVHRGVCGCQKSSGNYNNKRLVFVRTGAQKSL
ncbi:hypothetical protein [Virgibacillus sp. CM-4]|uniref:hypothetical protein n=1 Tax=Virgibacillus sp. CM-4 TaxID=1354277 RepID=UPI0012DD315D|nr:hypothetical protein [Virgibacillus sp. CM-4]